MKTYDWIVVGGGITGAALAYELQKQRFDVLLLEQDASLQGATRYSYGGLAYWAGTSDLTQRLCQEGKERYSLLAEELETDIQLREMDLLLTISAQDDPQKVAATYANFATPPKLLSVEAAGELEPLLNKNAISGALTVRHGQIQPEITNQAYLSAFRRAGGEMQIAQVIELLRQGDTISGVKTAQTSYHAHRTVICAGGLSRALLKAAGIPVRLYFTHAELVEIPPGDIQLQVPVMPAITQRFELEAKVSTAEIDPLWDQLGNEPLPAILDPGAVQFLDGTIRMGQLSRVLTDPNAAVDAQQSEAAIRSQVGNILPALEKLPGIWHHCRVAFNSNRLGVIGALSGVSGAYIFSGFTNPLVFVPPLAVHFANWATGNDDQIMAQISPGDQISVVAPTPTQN
ncbi:MAG: FAD-binding oxidoreductase [Coleofasciculaceae cyanobacterium]